MVYELITNAGTVLSFMSFIGVIILFYVREDRVVPTIRELMRELRALCNEIELKTARACEVLDYIEAINKSKTKITKDKSPKKSTQDD